MTPEGKVTPVPGTAEAFQKYLELALRTGPNAEAAKGMLTAINASVDTKYSNPSAPPAKKGTKKGSRSGQTSALDVSGAGNSAQLTR